MKRRLTLLGATGSIGATTLEVVARHPDRFDVVAVAANSNADKLATLCRRFRPAYAALCDRTAAAALARTLAAEGASTRVLAGAESLIFVATLPEVDTVLAGIVGAAGLHSTIAAAGAGKRILLANKEALVIGGACFMQAVADGGATLLPIDSEHNAVFQCLPQAYARDPRAAGIRRIWLTASGGPFRGRHRDELTGVTPEQALAHPTWRMGPVITVNSATLLNKGLELIETHLLFGVPYERIDVVVHPQSVVHSMVTFTDGSTLAQASPPDMRLPIALALGWPDRVPGAAPSCDFATAAGWTFEPLDGDVFPAVELARAAGTAGGCVPAVLNAANEEAVAAFLDGASAFRGIVDTVAAVVGEADGWHADPATVDEVLAAEDWARARARELLGGRVARARGNPT